MEIKPPFDGFIEWRPIIAGALTGTALSFVLFTFGAALGLAVSSTSPTWRDASVALALLSGLYILLTAIASFGLGGYVAGRLRSTWTGSDIETDFRDGVHGLLMWALAVTLGALLAASTASAILSRAAPATGAPDMNSAEPLIAYDLDRLFRTERPPGPGDVDQPRSEAARIALNASGHSGPAADDRTHLSRLVASRTGIAQPEADRRTDEFISHATTAIQRARRSSVLVAFITAASILFGLVIAWSSACFGGAHRDGRRFVPKWDLWRSIEAA